MNRIALVTGASGGIGAAIARRFAETGYAVALQFHNHADRAQAVAETLPNDAPHCCVYADLCDSASVEQMKQEIHKRLGTVAVLVNCAGIALPQMLLSDTTDEQAALVLETNVQGMIRTTRAFYDDLRKNSGAVVNLSSVWGVVGGSCEVVYSASKAAVIGFTKALAKELGPSGVTVNCIAPGWIDTPMNAHLSEQAKQAFVEDTPLSRIGTPQDVADAALFLAESPFLTGQVLCCDGGYSL